ncbi:MAG TPA: replication-relaxation family protein [Candidatus Omnitrophota bacterium]|nr:replication-relaxation family protein [Candidatus Omnitrophota bacterium]
MIDQPLDNESASDDSDELMQVIQPIELTDRDIAVFRLIHEHRYLAYGQIREAFWKERSEPAKACYRRIERLINSGFLSKGYSGRKNLNIYFVTEKSLGILKNRNLDSGIRLYEPTPYFDRSIDHDLKVASVRIFFRQFGLDGWIPERVLRERDHLFRVPDGILTLRGKRIAIEFENHLTKSMKRYQEVFDYYSDHKLYLLLLMIIDGDTKDWLVHGMRYNAQKIWITTYRELMSEQGETLFENKRASFKLSRLF